MGGFLKVLGAIALVIILLIGGLFVWGLMVAVPLVKSAMAYTDDAVPAIAKSWDREELLKRAAPDLKANLTPEGLDSVYALFTSFGPLVKYNGSECNVAHTVSTASGPALVVGCVATAKCQNADVQFQMALLQTGKSWQIAGILVSKATLVNATGAAPSSYGFGAMAGSPLAPGGFHIPLRPLTWLAFHGRDRAHHQLP